MDFFYFNKIIIVVNKIVVLAENDCTRYKVFTDCIAIDYADVGVVSPEKFN
jgi:hypothetical protein